MPTIAAKAEFSIQTEVPMSDVIDSLKRLERVGSENSKTTQKLIEAAHELETVIVKQFAENADIAVANGVYHVDVAPCALFFAAPDCPWKRVSGSRSSALQFAEDIADGLLDVITESLAESRDDAERASRTFGDARRRF